MVERELGRLMAEKEKEILAELSTRQGKIDELQKRLKDIEQQSSTAGGSETAETKRSREELERQLAAEKAAKEQRERSLEEERQRALDEARRNAAAAAAAAQPTPTAVAAVAGPAQAQPAASTAQATFPPMEPTPVDRAETAAPSGPIAVTQNMFLDPTQADSMPAILKEAAVTWSRAALYSRRRGVIILQATVNADGRVEAVKVLRADHDGFGIPEAATEAVQKYLFKPGTKNGLNIKTYATVTIPYRFQTR